MKNSTEYLFDRPKTSYEPHLTIVASRKIADATVLMAKLVSLRDSATPDELVELIERHEAVREARDWWITIREEK